MFSNVLIYLTRLLGLYQCDCLGDWACSGSEEVENVKSLRYTDGQTDGCSHTDKGPVT
jgi:hypothetical protein